MRRGFLIAAGIGSALALAAPASAQSIRATAVIVEPVEAPTLEIRVKSVGGRLRVRQEQPVATGIDSRLLSRTYVGAGESGSLHLAPVRVRENGVMRLERRFVPSEGVPVGELRGSAGVLIDGAATLTITRVIAANS